MGAVSNKAVCAVAYCRARLAKYCTFEVAAEGGALGAPGGLGPTVVGTAKPTCVCLFLYLLLCQVGLAMSSPCCRQSQLVHQCRRSHVCGHAWRTRDLHILAPQCCAWITLLSCFVTVLLGRAPSIVCS